MYDSTISLSTEGSQIITGFCKNVYFSLECLYFSIKGGASYRAYADACWRLAGSPRRAGRPSCQRSYSVTQACCWGNPRRNDRSAPETSPIPISRLSLVCILCSYVFPGLLLGRYNHCSMSMGQNEMVLHGWDGIKHFIELQRLISHRKGCFCECNFLRYLYFRTSVELFK